MERLWPPESVWEPDQAEDCNWDCNPSAENMKHREMLRFANGALCLLGENALKSLPLQTGENWIC